MDLKGSLVDTDLKIYPSTKLLKFLESIPTEDVPANIVNLVKGKKRLDSAAETIKAVNCDLSNEELAILSEIKKKVPYKAEVDKCTVESVKKTINDTIKNQHKDSGSPINESKEDVNEINEEESKKLDESAQTEPEKDDLNLNTRDVDWLFTYLQERRRNGEKDVPYLHVLFEGSTIEVPKNRVIKRNPVLEARCVKLRAQQEAREYRSMTKGVDNVRIRYPEDSISYQLKQMNRQLIAIGQFILSIFAGFLFGFRGIEWLVGTLDFGFRMLLGVMCALVIALAEIYFLAKKLNEELNLSQSETIQIGGPPKLLKDENHTAPKRMVNGKEHQD